MVKVNNSGFHSFWSEEEKVYKSFTLRELWTIYLALGAYSSMFQNHCIKWISESENCVCIVSLASTKRPTRASINGPRREKTCLRGFLQNSNQSPQLQGLARYLKFCL